MPRSIRARFTLWYAASVVLLTVAAFLATELLVRLTLARRPHVFLVVFPLLLLGATAWGSFFMRRVFAPIRNVVALATRIGAEDLSQRIEAVGSRDEISDLIQTLNQMIARLERSFGQIRQFSSDVAHELRTPLTIIRGEAEVALRRERSSQEYRAVLRSLDEEAGKLQAIIDDLLFLARMEARQPPLRGAEVDLGDLLQGSCRTAVPRAADRGVRLEWEPFQGVRVPGDAGLLERLFDNLLRNAIGYTPAGGRVAIRLTVAADALGVEVSDTGCGIPEAALPHVFDRFYRVDASRSQDTGGVGLGLAIARKIAELHGASLTVESVVGQGTTFRVTLPRAASASRSGDAR